MNDHFSLPKQLGDGLVLRWATPADTDALAAFNVRSHTDNPENPETWLAHWTEDLMRGDHPTTTASDFTVVVDENGGGKIVSTLNLISQTWAYEGIPFGVGRPELVATDPDYRRRGLVREQMTAVHAKSAARGELVQAITGIPWYYRMFGYGMALDLGGGRTFLWDRPGNYKPVEEEPYQIRPATEADWPLLGKLYDAHNRGSLLNRVRDETIWRYELTVSHPDSAYARQFRIVETAENRQPVAYVEYKQWGPAYTVREFGVQPGHSWRAVGLFVTRHFKKLADALFEKEEKRLLGISFGLGQGHPIYEALGRQLEPQRRPYAWFIRVPDLPAFLRHIGPVLEKRLAQSVLAGHSGTCRVNLYQQQFTLVFEQGKLKEIGSYEPKNVEDGDIHFSDSTFLHVLFGKNSLEELNETHADCYSRDPEAAVLFNILFPKKPSWVVGLG
ncbi:GNAT family N-acetyltransferase [Candidatus Leptofilum sp.]|uniref:GNAT family N-acetyltransferase n=1 Tax=Candidatus Leptofilum sp. TaxID=3241576 RepID=UPI003B5A93AF